MDERDINQGVRERMAQLDDLLAGGGGADAELLSERGRLHYSQGAYDKALNDFLRVLDVDPGNTQALQYRELINDIYEFRYVDYYNP